MMYERERAGVTSWMLIEGQSREKGGVKVYLIV